MTINMARMELSIKVLEELLCLNKLDIHILQVGNVNYLTGEITLYISGKNIPESPEGSMVPKIQLTLKKIPARPEKTIIESIELVEE